jgi:hypothetical protein
MPETIQVAHPPLIPALAVQARPCTARATARSLHDLEKHPHLKIALIPEDAVSRER